MTFLTFLLQGEGVGVFDLIEDKGTVERTYAVKIAKNAQDEFLVSLHILAIYLQQEIILA